MAVKLIERMDKAGVGNTLHKHILGRHKTLASSTVAFIEMNVILW